MEILAGLHPRLVHFPIAFFVLYFLLETAGVMLKKEFLTKAAYIVLGLGILSALAAVLTGNQAHEVAKNLIANNSSAKQLVESHETFATYSLWYFAALFFYRTYLVVKKKFSEKFQFLFILLSLLGCVLILLAGYYGGDLVINYGIGTKLLGK